MLVWLYGYIKPDSSTQTANDLRRTIHQNRQEWIDTCREATEAINKAKTKSWKDILQDAVSNSDCPNTWKVIQGLNGTPDANSPNEAMSHDHRTITDINSKANVFINHYARVSKLTMSQSDRDINQQFKKCLNTPSLTTKAVLHSFSANCNLPSRWGKVKEQLTLTTFHLHFSSHLVLWPSRNYYPY